MNHELDTNGDKIHIDVDQQIPTGVCYICAAEAQDTTPENEDHNGES